MHKKIAVYSCITNHVDDLINDQPEGADYFIFSDKDPHSKTWKFIQAEDLYVDPRRVARYYKLWPQKFFVDYDATIWMDGSIQMLVPPQEVVKLFLAKGSNIGVYIHPRRDCAYEEAKVCRVKKLDTTKVIQRQIAKYKRMNFPRHYGLAETKVVVRNNSILTKIFNLAWFEELMDNSKRDQISFPFVMWKTKIPVNVIHPSINDHGFFKFYKHTKGRKKINYENLAQLQG